MPSLEPAEPLLLREFENASASATVTAEGFVSVADWSHSSDPPLPDGVTVTSAGLTWTIGWELVPDLFPIVSITYLEDGYLVDVVEWEDVPEEADKIIDFKALTVNQRTYEVTVTATGLQPGVPAPLPAVATATYQVIILQQYDTNRDTLKEEVDARR